MGLVIVNNEWTLDKELTTNSYETKLHTAGKFLDRNINIIITPRAGTIELTSTAEVQQSIELVNNAYNVTTNVQMKDTLPLVRVRQIKYGKPMQMVCQHGEMMRIRPILQ